jgi:hypothetical protein
MKTKNSRGTIDVQEHLSNLSKLQMDIEKTLDDMWSTDLISRSEKVAANSALNLLTFIFDKVSDRYR